MGKSDNPDARIPGIGFHGWLISVWPTDISCGRCPADDFVAGISADTGQGQIFECRKDILLKYGSMCERERDFAREFRPDRCEI